MVISEREPYVIPLSLVDEIIFDPSIGSCWLCG